MEKMEKMLLQMMMNEDGIHLQFLVWFYDKIVNIPSFCVKHSGISVASF